MDLTFNRDSQSATGQLSSVLIVDQLQETRNFLTRSLQNYFALVDTCENIAQANDLHNRCHYDLIITDVYLADGNSLDWVRQLRQQGELTGVIFMAENTDVELTLEALRADVQDFIIKPFNIQQLKTAVERFVDRQRCRAENQFLRRQVDQVFNASTIIGESAAVKNLQAVISRIAPMPSTVLIEGESGTGKELVARALHDMSGRKGSFVPVNCGGMTAELLESELFGHARGAFTGAHQARDGLFAFAKKGTLFLDEIGEMPLSMQAHLLRVLEERSIRPVGSNQQIDVDVRIVAATNRDLQQLVRLGRFRGDLYYRLNVVSVSMPPLRQRNEDIPLLARHFCKRLSVELGVTPPVMTSDELDSLTHYDWPGNVRELKNVIERCLLLNHSPSFCLSVPAKPGSADALHESSSLLLEDVEKQHILKVLEMQGGNKSAAARILGVSRKTLERKTKAWEMA